MSKTMTRDAIEHDRSRNLARRPMNQNLEKWLIAVSGLAAGAILMFVVMSHAG